MHIVRKVLRAAVRVLAVLAVLLLSGITVQARSEQAERLQFPAPGQLIDIGGGRHIHMRTWGTRASPDQPAVVLDVSASMPLAGWAWVARGLAEGGNFVVGFDRPGMGWSTGPWQPRDAAHAADALGRALKAAKIDAPYLVVAHSYGGFSSRVFAGANRSDVAGLVLLDTTHPDGGGEVSFATGFRLRAWQGHAGLFQPAGRMDNGFSSLPFEEQAPSLAVSRWTTHLDTTAEELEAWHVSAAQVRAADLEGLRILVVSGDGGAEHLAQQRDMLNLSAHSEFAQIPASHMALLVQEGPAELVIEQIDGFVGRL
jgi:pimeloyl-ACP methyl ester carboxylesterase